MPLTRRQFIHVASTGIAAAAAGRLLSKSAFALAATDDPFATLDGIAQAQAVKKGDATAIEILDFAIRRIERLNPQINAVVTTDFEAARSRARENKFQGPFAGVPFLVKDLDNFAGVRTTYGSRAMTSHIAEASDPYIAACVDAGFNVAGKSNTPELGLTGTTESLALGPCYNPWDLTRSSGGSSGGAGAAVAAGMVPVAQGSDGGGSIRIPASCCGVFGLKPSRGRMVGSTDEFTFSVKGALSRTVRDTAHVLAQTERKQPEADLEPVGLVTGPEKRRLKIGLSLKGIAGRQPSADVSDAVLSTAKLCEELGHDVRMFRIEAPPGNFAADFLTVWSSAPGQAFERFVKERGRKPTLQDFEPLTLLFAAQYHDGAKERIPAAIERLKRLSAQISEQMRPYDVVLSPVLSSAPPLIGEMAPTVPFKVLVERMVGYVAYTPVYNVTGMPAMSVPLYWNAQGLPIGSQFAAQVGEEKTLLSLAYELEQARPWADKWPGCSAVKESV
jgi:amidase